MIEISRGMWDKIDCCCRFCRCGCGGSLSRQEEAFRARAFWMRSLISDISTGFRPVGAVFSHGWLPWRHSLPSCLKQNSLGEGVKYHHLLFSFQNCKTAFTKSLRLASTNICPMTRSTSSQQCGWTVYPISWSFSLFVSWPNIFAVWK